MGATIGSKKLVRIGSTMNNSYLEIVTIISRKALVALLFRSNNSSSPEHTIFFYKIYIIDVSFNNLCVNVNTKNIWVTALSVPLTRSGSKLDFLNFQVSGMSAIDSPHKIVPRGSLVWKKMPLHSTVDKEAARPI